MMQPALLGGLFIGVLSGLPVISAGNYCCCLWILGGGFVAAYVDSQRVPGNLPVSRGAADGFAAGVVGAVVWLLVAMSVNLLLAPIQDRLAAALMTRASTLPPSTRAFIQALGDDTTPLQYAGLFMVQLCVGSVVAAIGGMLGAMYFRKDVPPALGGTYVPPIPADEN